MRMIAVPFSVTEGEFELPEHRSMGYARVSSVGQNLDRQIMELRRYVSEECIVVDKASGKDLDRPGYHALKGPLGLRRGDSLYIKSLDRLSRSKADIKSELEWFQENGVNLKILDLPTTLMHLETGQEWIQNMVNNILIEVMSSFAEQERIMIRRRQKEGIDAARKKGKHMGRPKYQLPENWDVVYSMWTRKEVTGRDAMRLLGMKKSSFYKAVRGNAVLEQREVDKST